MSFAEGTLDCKLSRYSLDRFRVFANNLRFRKSEANVLRIEIRIIRHGESDQSARQLLLYRDTCHTITVQVKINEANMSHNILYLV